MPRALFDFFDVSHDAAAHDVSGVSPAAIAAAKALGFTELGWIETTIKGDFAFVSHVSLSESGLTTLTLTNVNAQNAAAESLLEDGTIISTETVAGIAETACIAVQRTASDPALRYRHTSSRATSLEELLSEHEALVAALATPDNPRVPLDLRANVAMRRRWREIADPDARARGVVAARVWNVTLFGGIAAAALAAWRTYVVAHERYGAEIAGVAALAAVAITMIASYLTFFGIVSAIQYGWARFARPRSPERPARPARELLELGRDLERDDLSPDIVAATRRLPVATSDLRTLLRADAAASIGAALLFALLGLGLNLGLGIGGALATVGLFLCADGAQMLRTGDGIVRSGRRIAARKLVEAEDEERGEDAEALIAPMALLRCLFGAVTSAIAIVLIRARDSADITPARNIRVAWLVCGIALAAWAHRNVRKRHARVRAVDPW